MTKVIRGTPQQLLKNYTVTAIPDIKYNLSLFPITVCIFVHGQQAIVGWA
jgi:hypothetical protein